VAEQDRSVVEAVARDGGRLRSFIRRRVVDPVEAEDVLQDVFHELLEATRLLQPIEQVGAWLFRVARNRITDLLRRQRTRGVEVSADTGVDHGEDAADDSIEDWLPSHDAGPDAAYARRLLLEELDAALDELPEAQRHVFVAHELEGRSFKDLAAESGVGMNTLLARKRYAVLHLRRRLQAIHDDLIET
jgi:RNA polymerase sigma factor (sigma-70 family)